MVVWIGPGSNESMGPMASAAACCIADQCVELSPVECDDAGGQQYGQACQVQVCAVRADGMVPGCCAGFVRRGLPNNHRAACVALVSWWCRLARTTVCCWVDSGSARRPTARTMLKSAVEITEEESPSESPEIAPVGGWGVAVDANAVAPPPRCVPRWGVPEAMVVVALSLAGQRCWSRTAVRVTRRFFGRGEGSCRFIQLGPRHRTHQCVLGSARVAAQYVWS